MNAGKLKKWLYIIISLMVLGLLASCNNSQNTTNAAPEMLNVNLSIKPEYGKPGQPITFQAKVTQGNEKVNDANDVVFEIWRSKDSNHEKITIKNPKDGVYQLKKTFQQDGTYYIISHVTARGMHNMPKKTFTVGTPSEPETGGSNSSMGGMNMDGNKSSGQK